MSKRLRIGLMITAGFLFAVGVVCMIFGFTYRVDMPEVGTASDLGADS